MSRSKKLELNRTLRILIFALLVGALLFIFWVTFILDERKGSYIEQCPKGSEVCLNGADGYDENGFDRSGCSREYTGSDGKPVKLCN